MGERQDPHNRPELDDTEPEDTEPEDAELAALRAELAEVDEHPLVERVRLFERANEVLAARLAELDEV